MTLDDSSSASGAATKRCPECAEEVLAPARKCRYCGYRFDRRPRGTRSLLRDLLPGLRRAQEATLEEILADWGMNLDQGEIVRWFRLADVDQSPGYLLVTTRRLVFFKQTSRTQHERALEYPLAVVSGVRRSGHATRRRLELRAGVLGHVVRAPGHRQLESLGDYLEAVVAGSARGGVD